MFGLDPRAIAQLVELGRDLLAELRGVREELARLNARLEASDDEPGA